MIYRVDVSEVAGDAVGRSVAQQIREFGIESQSVRSSRIFLIDSDSPKSDVLRYATALLADPIVETATPVDRGQTGDTSVSRIEIHLKPGVMDPVATSTEMALRDMGLNVREVRTGRAYLIGGSVPRERLQQIASRVLANGVIESIHFDTFVPERFETGHEAPFQLRHVPLRELTDEQLTKLSREGHLFLSLAEMKAVQTYFREQNREPTDIELETLAQTWSEHCVHKTLKSAVDVRVEDAAGRVVAERSYKNLIKETIFASTQTLMAQKVADPFCLSVFADNAGVIAFDETDAVCFKAETHNHPSAIEPYGGSATGVGGVIRDILGTGLAARPIANTDVFCVAFPDYGKGSNGTAERLPRGVIHPKRVLNQIVAGVRDYGNRMGIPTVNGAVYFDNRYLGNPLVFCGCIGLIPRDKIAKQVLPGDAIVVMGGRTGRDGIHGATFSSAELTDTHADEFSHAVQIGNAITEKKVADVLLTARDRGLFTAVTDCGAGGLSSAIGEMGEKLGAVVELDRVPLKYAGLRYDEIWISEAQERMVLSAPEDHLEELLSLCKSEDVEATVIGTFGTPNEELILNYRGTRVGNMSMHFLHDGIPTPRRIAVVKTSTASKVAAPALSKQKLLATLSHPNVASKHWIIRQYDHEVQGGSVIKPLTGPLQVGPSDAAVIRPKLSTHRGIAIGCGLCPQVENPYEMTLAAIDEAVRNVVAVGADPNRIAILDNFCWPSVDDPQTMGTLVRACEACRDAALAYGIPFISGKDSLHNQFTDSETGKVIRIPNTLLISAIGVMDDVRKCITMDFKKAGNPVVMLTCAAGKDELKSRRALHQAVADAIAAGFIVSCHDASDGGAIVAIAEMAIASDLGAELTFIDEAEVATWTTEQPATYLVELTPAVLDPTNPAFKTWFDLLTKYNVLQHAGGSVTEAKTLKVFTSPANSQAGKAALEVGVEEMRTAWRGTLDW